MIIDLATFLRESIHTSWWNSLKYLCFKGDTYSPLLFHLIFSQLTTKKILPFEKNRIDGTHIDKKNIQSILNQCILGNNALYWLGDIEKDVSDKQKKELMPILISYTGPHILAYFLHLDTSLKIPSYATTVTIPTTIDQATARALIDFYVPNLHQQKQRFFFNKIQQLQENMFDHACMLLNYLELTNLKQQAEVETYVDQILQTTPTLNQLTDYFFSKNAPAFFDLWSTIEHIHQPMFWIAFWSEQLWRAHAVITYLKKQDFIQAKKMSYRLPFSFIKTTWKQTSQQELAFLFHHLYTIDRTIKQGCSSPHALHLFFFFYFFHHTKPSSLSTTYAKTKR